MKARPMRPMDVLDAEVEESTMKKRNDDAADRGRRNFLGKLAVAGAATTVAATSAGAMADAGAEEDARVPSASPDAQGYHLTRHIQDYYRAARD